MEVKWTTEAPDLDGYYWVVDENGSMSLTRLVSGLVYLRGEWIPAETTMIALWSEAVEQPCHPKITLPDKNTCLITIKGGCIDSVYSDSPGLNVIIHDYDAEPDEEETACTPELTDEVLRLNPELKAVF